MQQLTRLHSSGGSPLVESHSRRSRDGLWAVNHVTPPSPKTLQLFVTTPAERGPTRGQHKSRPPGHTRQWVAHRASLLGLGLVGQRQSPRCPVDHVVGDGNPIGRRSLAMKSSLAPQHIAVGE